MIKDLNYYINHPVYGVGYVSVTSYLGVISMHDRIEFTDDKYLAVFAETEKYVERVLNSKNPEIEIPRTFSLIEREYRHTHETEGFINVSTYRYHLGGIIELLFLIAVYDLMPERSEIAMDALKNCRQFIEYHNNTYEYTNDKMWALVAERIPPIPNRPRVEDLQFQIIRLNEDLEEYRTQTPSHAWEELVEDCVKDFDIIMKPVGFYDIPMINKLSRLSQCKFIMKLQRSSMPFKVALLNHIGIMEFLTEKKGYKVKSERLRLIEKALNINKNSRELKGNFNVLKDGSDEDVTKYTSYRYVQEVESFYNGLL